jgi:hypothetical protein
VRIVVWARAVNYPAASTEGVSIVVPREADTATAPVVDMARLETRLPSLRGCYTIADPFPHVVLDDFLVPSAAQRAREEFLPADPEGWINYLHVNERKYANADPETWGPTLRSVAQQLCSPPFVRFLSELTGIKGLVPDESMHGGGLHQSLPGGFLNIHSDFTVHPQRRDWRRRVNLLLYFNEEWPSDYGGELEFWSADMKTRVKAIAPLGNRVVIFNTDPDSFHGHPDPLRCPPGMARQSMALYYFTVEEDPPVRATDYRARPNEGPRALLIRLDNLALRAYDRLRRQLRISDRAASRLLKGLQRLRRGPRD